MEMLMTMKLERRMIDNEEVPFLDFRLKDEERFIIYEDIGNLLGFKAYAPEMVEVEEGLDGFCRKIAKDDNHQRRNISHVKPQIIHSWMRKRFFGRMRESKVTDMELNWLYSALVKRQAIDPTIDGPYT